MITVHSTLVLTSVWPVSASDFRPDELTALLSLQNRQGATQQLVERSQTTQVAPEKVSFCPHFCGLSSAQNGRGCCVKTDGGTKFSTNSQTNRDRCQKSPNTSVWCTGGQSPWPGTQGNTLMKIAGWDCETDDGWHLGGATGVVCDLPTLTAVAVDVAPFTDPIATTPAPTPAWNLVQDGFKCKGQVHDQTTEASRHDCEQLAIQTKHAFYQYHARKKLCVRDMTCLNRIEAVGWAIYRDNELWPLKQMSESCTNKPKDTRIAGSQRECQQQALDRVNPKTNMADPARFYTWQDAKKLCRVSKKCKNNPAAPRYGTYSQPTPAPTPDPSDCSKSREICRDVEQSSDKCLSNRPSWYSTGPDHQPHKFVDGTSATSDVLCADNVQFCSDPYWGRDMLDCCPSTCNIEGVSIQESPAATMAHIDLDAAAVQVYRASILHFIDNPWKKTATDDLATLEEETYEFFEDGYLMVEEGKVKGRGNWADLSATLQDGAYEYPGRLIVPGFVDTHIHAPQTEIIAAFGASLIPWLEKYTFPAESKYSDTVHAKDRAEVFVKELLRAGTTTALAFSTRHKDAADALFETFNEYNMLHISGKVLMDDPGNAPDGLRDDDAKSSIDETRDLIEKWHGVGRNLYAITPRFAPTSTLHQMNLTGELMKEFPDVYMHTHLSESMGEIGWVNWQFSGNNGADADRHIGSDSANKYGATDHNGHPGHLDGYLSVYDHFGMLGPKSIFAHSIHLSAKEWQRLGETDSTVSFCPTSNNFLGSGLFNAAQAVKHKVRFGMGTDVGAGTSFSMLRTMGDGYKALKLGESWLKHVDPFLGNLECSQPVPRAGTFPTNPADWAECGVVSNYVVLSAAKAFYTATMGGASQLSLDHRIGNFVDGKEADFVVLNFGGGREFVADRMADAFLNAKEEPKAKLMEKLFVLMMMGDDRHVEATYVYGDRVFSQ